MPSFYILDVGHGNSAVLIDRDGVVVIDAGPNTVLLDFLIDHHIQLDCQSLKLKFIKYSK